MKKVITLTSLLILAGNAYADDSNFSLITLDAPKKKAPGTVLQGVIFGLTTGITNTTLDNRNTKNRIKDSFSSDQQGFKVGYTFIRDHKVGFTTSFSRTSFSVDDLEVASNMLEANWALGFTDNIYGILGLNKAFYDSPDSSDWDRAETDLGYQFGAGFVMFDNLNLDLKYQTEKSSLRAGGIRNSVTRNSTVLSLGFTM